LFGEKFGALVGARRILDGRNAPYGGLVLRADWTYRAYGRLSISSETRRSLW
jgi:hypothetical protein